jgi:hypothetical protein
MVDDDELEEDKEIGNAGEREVRCTKSGSDNATHADPDEICVIAGKLIPRGRKFITL